MKTVITFNGVYKPGFKGGGPVKSIAKMVELLHENINFKIVCSDRDHGDENPYKNIIFDTWLKGDNEEIYYHSGDINIIKLFKILKKTRYEIIFLNGYFSLYTIMILALLSIRIINMPEQVIISPRGDFTEGNSNNKIKKFKKKLYIFITKHFKFFKKVKWHTTSQDEMNAVKTIFGDNGNVYLIPNISFVENEVSYTEIDKKEKKLKLTYISRITPKKNLLFSLETLSQIEDINIEFDIFGPVFDKEYWNLCEEVIKKSPSNIQIKYHGSIQPQLIAEVFKNSHFLFFPTHGENYGHIIVEALIHGCPVIISDTTPWVKEPIFPGYVIPLSQEDKYLETIKEVGNMNYSSYNVFRKQANDYIKRKVNSNEIAQKYKNMFLME